MHAGEVRVILGENGSGKTTLVRLLTGDLVPDKGEIAVLGKPVKIKSPQQARLLGISVAYQNFTLFTDMSVATNLFLFRDPRHGSFISSNAVLEKARSFLDEIGFLSDIDPREKISNLSAGQQKQLQVATVIMQDAPIVIMDDPTSYLSDE